MMHKMCGLYEIVNLANRKRYVGSSFDIDSRWRSHKSALNRGRHRNSHLQRAWSKYGRDAFVFSVIKLTSREDKLKEEQALLDGVFSSKEEVYNIGIVADSGMTGRTHSDEAKAKIGRSKIGKSRPKEMCLKLSLANQGKRPSKETVELIRAKSMGKNNPFYGKTHTEETKAKIAAARRWHALTSEEKSMGYKKIPMPCSFSCHVSH
jgi:group I intron endonuclease